MRKRLVVVLLVFSTVSLLAEQADPSGHWTGVIHAPGVDVPIEVDLAGAAGTFSNPARGVRGFPLSGVAVDGAKVTFAIKADGGGTFAATLAGTTLKGVFTTRAGDGKTLELPFELTRTGDAQIEAAAASPAVGNALVGAWSGSLEVEGLSRTIGVTIRNHPNGTATGVVITSAGAEIAITRIAHSGVNVTLDVSSIGGKFEGTLHGDALTGTWTQGPFNAPLTFRRSGSPAEASLTTTH